MYAIRMDTSDNRSLPSIEGRYFTCSAGFRQEDSCERESRTLESIFYHSALSPVHSSALSLVASGPFTSRQALNAHCFNGKRFQGEQIERSGKNDSRGPNPSRCYPQSGNFWGGFLFLDLIQKLPFFSQNPQAVLGKTVT